MSPESQRRFLTELLVGDRAAMAALRAARDLGLPDWAIGGGFLRNRLWDRLVGRDAPISPTSDIDLLFFDPSDLSNAREARLEAALSDLLPGALWEVRNQARMHLHNLQAPYGSTEAAIAQWTETATAIAVRLEADERLKFLAPHGLDDLFDLICRPTPNGRGLPSIYRRRIANKGWRQRWPELRVVDTPPRSLALLHSAADHIATFDRLGAELAPDLPLRHALRPDLLDAAVAAGAVSPATGVDLDRTLRKLAGEGAGAILCSCSTLGAAAEAANIGLPVLRLDRAMARQAVRQASRILLLAALPATLAPSAALLEAEAAAAGRRIALDCRLVEEAWPLFLAGAHEAYGQKIATALRDYSGDSELAVLAQASMEPAAALCRDLKLPILSSPRPGFLAALEALDRAGSTPADDG